MFDSKQWPEDVGSRVTYGEAEMKLSQIFHLSEREMIRGFQKFLKEKEFKTNYSHLNVLWIALRFHLVNVSRDFHRSI
jgi:hypothetical protein